jgi:hypothetical protein
MRLVLLLVAVLVVAFVPAAEARRAPTRCALSEISAKVNPGNKCRRLGGGRPASAVRVSMTGLGLQGPVAPAPQPSVARLGVTAREWSLVLSRAALPAGPARVQLQNLGEDAHNLRLERVDGTSSPLNVPLAEAGEVQDGSGALTVGSYKVYCALPGHDAAGMHARLIVR